MRHPLYQGFAISRNEDGYFWRYGGYFPTLRDCQRDIAHWNCSELFHEPTPLDTPALDEPWWSHA